MSGKSLRYGRLRICEIHVFLESSSSLMAHGINWLWAGLSEDMGTLASARLYFSGNPLVGDRRRFRRGLSEPGVETRLAESCVIAGNECPLTQLHAVVTRVRVSDNLARIIACG